MRPLRTLATALLAAAALPAAADASSLKVANGVVVYTDTSATNANAVVVALSPDGSRITVTESGKTSRNRAITLTTDGTCSAVGSAGSCPAAGVSSITVDSGGANDSITQSTSLPSKLIGGAGNDSLTGGAGDDTFPNGAGADTVAGGGGFDAVDYGAATASVSVSLDGGPGDGASGENDNIAQDVEAVTGGPGDDVLTGNDGDNRLVGGAGNDTLTAAGGNDSLDGGAGNDNEQAGAGDDVLAGGAATDNLVGGDGNDLADYSDAVGGVTVDLDGQADDGPVGENDNADVESIVGSGADDVLIGNAGSNTLSGGSGNDRILGAAGADTLDGGSGDDILQSLDGAKDLVACGDGEDGVVTDRRDVRAACDFIKYRTLAASSTRLHVSRGYLRIPVRCSPGVVQRCAGKLRIAAGKTPIGSLRFNLAPGRRWVARVKVTRSGARLVRRQRMTTVSLRVLDRQAIPTTQTLRIGG